MQIEHYLTTQGTIGIIAYTGLYASSIPWIRRRLYEFFLVAHVLLAAVGLAATILHWRATAVWLWPGIGLWAADRLARILRLVILNKLWLVVPRPNASNIPSSATLTLLTPSTLMVTFENPASTLKWKAGQHFYVVMPGMSRLPWEAHPFTAITIPEPAGSREKGELSFVVRIRDGFTRLMKERVDEERKARGLPVDEQCSMKVQAAVEGPYGLAEDLSGYDAVLIFAGKQIFSPCSRPLSTYPGGSGISFALSHLLQIIEEARVGRTRVRSVKLVWMVKSRLHLSWISSILYSHTHRIPSTLQVSLDIYVTKQYFRSTDSIAPSVTSSGHAALPTNPTTQQSSDLAKYLAQHAEDPHARHRRRSRLMSTMSWATFTHAWHRGRDNHGAHTGPGTRRDTMAVVGGASQAAPPMIQVAHSQPVSVDDPTVLARDFAKPIFKWSDSFGQEHQPPVDESEAGRSSSDEQPSSLPASPTTRRRPLPLVINEEENNMGSMHGSPTSPVISIFAPNSRRGSSVLMPAIELARDERRRSSTAAGDSSEESHAPFHDRLSNRARSPSPGAPRQSSLKRKASTDLLGLRGTRQSLSSGEDGLGDSISRRPSSILRPIPLTGQGDPTAGANGRVSPGRRVSIQIDPTHGHRKASTVGLDPKELVHPTPVHGAGLMVDFAPRTVSSYLVPPSHAMVRDGSAGSANSTLSFQSTTSPLGSGALTPNIADKEAHHPASFAQESLQRRRQSVGLEGIVHWHEGRADLHAVIEGMIRDITIARGGGGAGGEAGAGAEGAKGKGGWLSVSACGPRSLLDTAREKVREVSTVKDVWQGGVAVDFHAETFGWD